MKWKKMSENDKTRPVILGIIPDLLPEQFYKITEIRLQQTQK